MPSSRNYSRSIAPRKPRRSTITIPKHVAPAVRLVFESMRMQRKTYQQLEDESGILRVTVKSWRHRTNPTLTSISAVLGALGFEFVPLPTESAIPDSIVDELRPIAERLDLAMPDAIRLLTEITYRSRKPAHEEPPTAPAPV